MFTWPNSRTTSPKANSGPSSASIPANSEANYNLGVLLMMKGSAASAIPHFERVHPATSAARFNLVRAYFQARRTADALRTANELSDEQ